MSNRPDIQALRTHKHYDGPVEGVETGLVFRMLEILYRLRIADFEDIHFYEWKGYALDMEDD